LNTETHRQPVNNFNYLIYNAQLVLNHYKQLHRLSMFSIFKQLQPKRTSWPKVKGRNIANL